LRIAFEVLAKWYTGKNVTSSLISGVPPTSLQKLDWYRLNPKVQMTQAPSVNASLEPFPSVFNFEWDRLKESPADMKKRVTREFHAFLEQRIAAGKSSIPPHYEPVSAKSETDHFLYVALNIFSGYQYKRIAVDRGIPEASVRSGLMLAGRAVGRKWRQRKPPAQSDGQNTSCLNRCNQETAPVHCVFDSRRQSTSGT
jgi:hypothetical protein